jgi:hypothetical protein
MKTVAINDLPPGSEVRGFLYEDPKHVYGLGDVLEVELPNGTMIDVGWDEVVPNVPFHIVVYREYYENTLFEVRVADTQGVVSFVQLLAKEHSQSGIANELPLEHFPSGIA